MKFCVLRIIAYYFLMFFTLCIVTLFTGIVQGDEKIGAILSVLISPIVFELFNKHLFLLTDDYDIDE